MDYVHQTGQKTYVIKNDAVTIDNIKSLNPQGIIISPGPKYPHQAGEIISVIQNFFDKIPILGICLGHQAIGHAFGAHIDKVPPMHGQNTTIMHNDPIIFKTIKQNILVGRYHSLAVINDAKFATDLEITAKTHDNIIMAMRHKQYPVFGLQFHPESILTQDGLVMIKNFVNYALEINNDDKQNVRELVPISFLAEG